MGRQFLGLFGNRLYFGTHGLEDVFVFDFSSEGHPEGQDVAAEQRLQVLEFSPIPKVDLHVGKLTASGLRYCILH